MIGRTKLIKNCIRALDAKDMDDIKFYYDIAIEQLNDVDMMYLESYRLISNLDTEDGESRMAINKHLEKMREAL